MATVALRFDTALTSVAVHNVRLDFAPIVFDPQLPVFNPSMSRRIASRYQQASVASKISTVSMAQGVWYPTRYGQAWQQGKSHQLATRYVIQQSVPMQHFSRSGWEHGQALANGASANWQQSIRMGDTAALRWQPAIPAGTLRTDLWRQLLPFNHARHTQWQQGSTVIRILWQAYQQALQMRQGAASLWQQGRRPPPGRSVDVVVIPPQPPYHGQTDLHFLCKLKPVDAHAIPLRFGLHPCSEASGAGSDNRTKFIVNEISFMRVSDGRSIELLSASVGMDTDSWCWSFTGSIPFSEIGQLDPADNGNTDVELVINGLVWRFMIESFSRNETFGKTTATIRGRSLTALLSEPYALPRSYTETASKTAVQLAQQEIDRSGLTGFTLDWSLIDAFGWTVPANIWNYQGRSPIQAIKRIAEDAGGILQSHPSSKTVIVKPEYAIPYWQWGTATPDLTLDTSIIRSLGTEWVDKPAYNGIRVSGLKYGVNALVKITGSDGGYQPEQVVASVLTEGAANRQRGITELSRYGSQQRRSIEMPLVAGSAMVLPAMLVQVGSWRGLVRSVGYSTQGQGKVSQVLEVEQHV